MKRKLTAALLSLCLALCVLFSGCNININLDSGTGSRALQALSELAEDVKDELNETESSAASSKAQSKSSSKTSSKASSKASSKTSSKASSGASSKTAKGSYTMADIKALKNTKNFAKNTLEHLFDGTINRKGKATGYHYNQVTDSKGEIIQGTESEKDSSGVFTAKVKVSGVKKDGFSSFYPEDWTPQQVVDAINEAYTVALSDTSNPHGSLWIGYSGDLEIVMYLDSNKKITTAYPIYKGD